MIEYPSHQAARDPISTSAAAAVMGPRTLLLAATMIAGLGAVVRAVTDPDFWMHVRVGRWIVENGRVPSHDLFAYTVGDRPWIDHEYLTQVLLWLLDARFGTAGVSVAFGALTWAGLGLVLLAARPGRQPYVVVGLAMALAVIAGLPAWGPRPQMLTFLFACLELLWLRRSVEGSGRAILWLPLVMVLWSNLHGGWTVGLVFLGVALVSEALGWLTGRDGAGHRVRRLGAVTAASVAAVAVNPNGLATYAYPVQTLTSGVQQSLIAEWASPNFHLPELWAFEVMLLLVVAGLAVGRPGRFDLLVALAAVALALQSVRHVSLFVAATTPVLVACWSDAWRRAATRLPRAGAARDRPPPRPWMTWATALVLVAVTATTGIWTASGLGRQAELTRQSVPVGAADWLAAHPDAGTRMFNEYAWGGYLAYRFFPDPHRRVFVFSEGVLVGDDLLARYGRVARLGPGWQRVLDDAAVDYVVVARGSPLDDVLATQAGWRLTYRDGTAVVYVRAATGSGSAG